MAVAIKTKSAANVCTVLVEMMYRYGPPRILQTNNGKEFNSNALREVVDEMVRKSMADHILNRKIVWKGSIKPLQTFCAGTYSMRKTGQIVYLFFLLCVQQQVTQSITQENPC